MLIHGLEEYVIKCIAKSKAYTVIELQCSKNVAMQEVREEVLKSYHFPVFVLLEVKKKKQKKPTPEKNP